MSRLVRLLDWGDDMFIQSDYSIGQMTMLVRLLDCQLPGLVRWHERSDYMFGQSDYWVGPMTILGRLLNRRNIGLSIAWIGQMTWSVRSYPWPSAKLSPVHRSFFMPFLCWLHRFCFCSDPSQLGSNPSRPTNDQPRNCPCVRVRFDWPSWNSERSR